MTEKSQKSNFGKKTVFYQQKFRQEWLTNPLLKNWLCEDVGNRKRAYCQYCKCNLLSKYCDLLTHSKTNKHLRAANLYEGNEQSTEVKYASSTISTSSISANIPKDNSADNALRDNKIKPLNTNKSRLDNISDGEYETEYNIPTDDEDELVEEILTDIDNEMHKNRSTVISRKLQAERIKAETEYFRQKALYFSKLTENSRIQRTLMILQSRKLHLEVQKLQNEL